MAYIPYLVFLVFFVFFGIGGRIPSRCGVAVIWLLALGIGGCGSSAVKRGDAGSADAQDTGQAWALWPMPNQPGVGLPNEQKYTVISGMTGEMVRDEVTRLLWQRRVDTRRFTWKDAMAYCDGLTLAGWDDWRLPSRIELVSLLDLTRTNPSINAEGFPGTPGDWFWTASRQADDPERSWFVYFYFGYPDTDPQQSLYPARCVR